MLVYADSDMFRYDHIVKFYQLLGGGLQDAGWQRENMSKNRLAIIPDQTHYDLVRVAETWSPPSSRSSTGRVKRESGSRNLPLPPPKGGGNAPLSKERNPCGNHRRCAGVPGWRHASARRADRGSDQGLQVRRLGDALFRSEFGEELDRVFREFDLLLGRKTYEIFAAYWPYYDEDAPHGGIAKLFNDIKKYAVSRSGEVDTSWAGSCSCATSPT
jgi:hypothetical protein